MESQLPTCCPTTGGDCSAGSLAVVGLVSPLGNFYYSDFRVSPFPVTVMFIGEETVCARTVLLVAVGGPFSFYCH